MESDTELVDTFFTCTECSKCVCCIISVFQVWMISATSTPTASSCPCTWAVTSFLTRVSCPRSGRTTASLCWCFWSRYTHKYTHHTCLVYNSSNPELQHWGDEGFFCLLRWRTWLSWRLHRVNLINASSGSVEWHTHTQVLQQYSITSKVTFPPTAQLLPLTWL